MRRILIITLSTLVASPAYATTIVAASCSISDITIAHTAAVDGDTVTVPAGDCTWTATLTITKAISLVGAGDTGTGTNVTDGVNGKIVVTPPSGQTVRISSFRFLPSWAPGSSTVFFTIHGDSVTAAQMRLDHLTWGTTASPWTPTSPQPLEVDEIFGVIDHVTVVDQGIPWMLMKLDSMSGIGSFGDNSWAQPTALGGAQAVFVEDSTFVSTVRNISSGVWDCDGHACRYVARYNTFIGHGVGHHGTETPGRNRGGRQFEVYNNNFYALDIGLDSTTLARSGTGIYANNTIKCWPGGAPGGAAGVASPCANAAIKLLIFRAGSNLGGWGYCDGTGQWDKNDGVIYETGTHTGSNGATILTDSTKSWTVDQWAVDGNSYSVRNITRNWSGEINFNTATTITPFASFTEVNHIWNTGDSYDIRRAAYCIDQPGRGKSDLLSGSPATPTGDPHNMLEPVYVWGNALTNVVRLVGRGGFKIKVNQDWYETIKPGYVPYPYPHPLVSGIPGSIGGFYYPGIFP